MSRRLIRTGPPTPAQVDFFSPNNFHLFTQQFRSPSRVPADCAKVSDTASSIPCQVAEPLLHRAEIDPSPKTSRRERCTEFVEPGVAFVDLRSLCNRLQAIEEV
jgi:hypothetical protein